MADNSAEDPVLRNGGHQKEDQIAQRFIDQTGKLQEKALAHRPGTKKDPKSQETKAAPAGGFDATPIPHAPLGYTLKITFHKAENLPFADINTISSDPYVIATMKTHLQKRHKQDPDLTLRTKTIHRNTNPVWEAEWVIANVPAGGFFLKCRLYDEDPADHDDRLGNVHVMVDKIDGSWKGFEKRKFDIKKRMGSKRAYMFRGCAAMVHRGMKMGGDMTISIENLGKTVADDGGRMWTVAPMAWSQHFSPLMGRLAGTKDMSDDKGDGKKKTEKYNFQAIQIQLQGPVPPELYHRYVEFKPFVAGMFTSHSLRGRILNRALHHQHARIYNYDRSTKYGLFQEPGEDVTKKFLEFVRYDQGGRIFTYVITLDAQWRFTETGKEFGVDMLSKHTMHSDVSIYIAFSGEFFIRRLKHPHRNKSKSPDPSTQALPPAPAEDDHEADASERSDNVVEEGPSQDPNMYEMIIDNDSGTYRPNAKYLHTLADFMRHNLPGLRVVTLDCNGDADKMKKLKEQQRELKKKSADGKQMTYLQNLSQSSLSSSDEEELDQRGRGNARKHEYQKKAKGLKDVLNPKSGNLGGGEDATPNEKGGEATSENAGA